MMDVKDAWLYVTSSEFAVSPECTVMRDIRERLDALERGARLNLRECRGARGVDAGANPDAACEVVGVSAAENDPLRWAGATEAENVLRDYDHRIDARDAQEIVSLVFNELRRQWKERVR